MGDKTPLAGFSPVIQFLLLGSQVDPATLQDHAEHGVAYLNANLSMDELAKREGGARDTIADAEGVLSPRNCYFIAVAPFTVGMVYPANRQDATKWVRFGQQNSQPKFSPAIQAGITAIAPATQFLLVLDLADAVHSKSPAEGRPLQVPPGPESRSSREGAGQHSVSAA